MLEAPSERKEKYRPGVRVKTSATAGLVTGLREALCANWVEPWSIASSQGWDGAFLFFFVKIYGERL